MLPGRTLSLITRSSYPEILTFRIGLRLSQRNPIRKEQMFQLKAELLMDLKDEKSTLTYFE